jgi:hypothetical protein
VGVNNKPIIILSIFIILVVGVAVVYFVFPEFGSKISRVVDLTPDKPKVIENENLVIPNTQKITGGEARMVEKGSVEVPLVPKNEGEKVIVSKAVLTVKGSYELAKIEAGKWSNDAKLVFIKSLGAITLEGKSSQWQLAFSSALKPGKGYEVIIQGDQIVSKKEIDSTATGVDLPKNLKDSGAAIISLQELPQFSDATVSSIQLYYNLDAKAWFYSFATSVGTTSGPAI